MFASARSFWLNVSSAASTTTRKRRNPGSLGVNVNDSRFGPSSSVTGWVLASSPLTNRRAVAGCAAVDVMSAVTSIDSPSRAVDGAASRSTSTSSRPPRPTRWVSTWIPRAAASAASRLAGAGGVVAVGEEDDPLLGVVGEQGGGEPERRADVGGRRDRGGRDAVDLARAPRGAAPRARRCRTRRCPRRPRPCFAASASRTYASESSRPCVPTESDRSTTNTTASRSTGQHELEPGERRHERGQQPDPDRRAPPAVVPRRGAGAT